MLNDKTLPGTPCRGHILRMVSKSADLRLRELILSAWLRLCFAFCFFAATDVVQLQ